MAWILVDIANAVAPEQEPAKMTYVPVVATSPVMDSFRQKLSELPDGELTAVPFAIRVALFVSLKTGQICTVFFVGQCTKLTVFNCKNITACYTGVLKTVHRLFDRSVTRMLVHVMTYR
jgi:hypothetical protein